MYTKIALSYHVLVPFLRLISVNTSNDIDTTMQVSIAASVGETDLPRGESLNLKSSHITSAIDRALSIAFLIK
jgi:hypothetical protein